MYTNVVGSVSFRQEVPEVQLTVTIRDTDVQTLKEWAQHDWRDDAAQASAVLETALHTYAKTQAPGQPRQAGRRGPRAQAA